MRSSLCSGSTRRLQGGASGRSKCGRAAETQPPDNPLRRHGSSGLNQEQRAPAAGLGGPGRGVAGAGTGKTAVIAERFRPLVAAGAQPGSILVMTFTERAAAEMAARIR